MQIMKKRFFRLFSLIFVTVLLLAVTLAMAGQPDVPEENGESGIAPAEEASEEATARPSLNGRLHVDGLQLVDETGEAVQLRGVSTHGLTWFPEFVDESLFAQIAKDWNGNLVRLAVYAENYCSGAKAKEENLTLLKKGIEAAIAADMYVIADWHVLEDENPNLHLAEAMAFFDQIAQEYADVPNLIFEICNEPNGDTTWGDIRAYSEQVIPVIRGHIPDALILVGTPEFDRNLGSAVLRPLSFDNIMYDLHFYAASHHEELRGELEAARNGGLPVFISECGLSEADGDGKLDFRSATEWFSYLNANGMSYTVWSLSDKEETSALLKTGFDPTQPVREEDLTPAGRWVRELIRGQDPAAIEAPAAVLEKSAWARFISLVSRSLGERQYGAVRKWGLFAVIALLVVGFFLLLLFAYRRRSGRKQQTYDRLFRTEKGDQTVIQGKGRIITQIILIISSILTLIYLCWRAVYSVPVAAGGFAIAANIILLVVELLGFAESLILYRNLLGLRNHPLPEIPEEEYPEVDIFIATYNEPVELLRRTVNGCTHLKYPDPAKVHVWICDDNRRPQMRQLAQEMGVGYFDRPDNQGAKAGNLNHAMAHTSAPYIVTFDADMIPKSDFLLKTIPYFVDVELKNRDLPEEEQSHLGLLQTPQCFYDPDVFQHALYSEKTAPNEQDFFYRTIEPAKTSTNSVIYGGSNTVLSRRALEDIGGFYTESITEDFATGLLIESKGYVSLALPEPLASGQTPHTYKEHIQQRTRWGRGVIVTARKLKIWRRRELSISQKFSYWSSVIYWYSPVKNLIYVIMPLLFAVFALPVFDCNWLELMIFWFPMFVLQSVSLYVSSRRTISQKWSGIYETSVMPHLLIPILKESLGITLSSFKVTDKSRQDGKRKLDIRAMLPFLVLLALSVAGVVRIIVIFNSMQVISLLILLFWVVRNIYYLLLAIFLVDGRDSDAEVVKVIDAVPVTVETTQGDKAVYEGITTRMTEHAVTVFLDEGETLGIGASVTLHLDNADHQACVSGVVIDIKETRRSKARTQTIEILDFGNDLYEYWEILYDRVPTLPQSLNRDYGFISHLWQNIAHRVARATK